MSRILICERVSVDSARITFVFARSAGPGGQNVNKVETAVQLRLDVSGETGIPPDVKQRLARLAGRRLTAEGVLTIDAQRFRSQARNREDALERMTELLRRASVPPVARIPTAPTAGARRRRLETKRARGTAKRLRRAVGTGED